MVQEQTAQEELGEACQYEEDGGKLYVQPLYGQPMIGVIAILGCYNNIVKILVMIFNISSW